MAQDRIRLVVPARGEYARTVRMTAAAIVSRMGMSYDEVDDVRMAAEEAFVYAVDTVPEGFDVTFDFLVDDDELAINVSLGVDTDVDEAEVEARTSYATFILDSVCDTYELGSDESGCRLMRLVKRARSGDDV